MLHHLRQARHLCHSGDLLIEDASDAPFGLGPHQKVSDLFMLGGHWDLQILLRDTLELTMADDVHVFISFAFFLQDLTANRLDHSRVLHNIPHLLLVPVAEEG